MPPPLSSPAAARRLAPPADFWQRVTPRPGIAASGDLPLAAREPRMTAEEPLAISARSATLPRRPRAEISLRRKRPLKFRRRSAPLPASADQDWPPINWRGKRYSAGGGSRS